MNVKESSTNNCLRKSGFMCLTLKDTQEWIVPGQEQWFSNAIKETGFFLYFLSVTFSMLTFSFLNNTSALIPASLFASQVSGEGEPREKKPEGLLQQDFTFLFRKAHIICIIAKKAGLFSTFKLILLVKTRKVMDIGGGIRFLSRGLRIICTVRSCGNRKGPATSSCA